VLQYNNIFITITELDENVEYEEKESEFDLTDEDRSVTQNEREVEDDLEVRLDSFVFLFHNFFHVSSFFRWTSQQFSQYLLTIPLMKIRAMKMSYFTCL